MCNTVSRRNRKISKLTSFSNSATGIGSAEDDAAQRGQSGLKAGDGGFDVKVAGNTDLKGGAMTSTASVENNRLTTGTLTFSDIANHSEVKASSDAISLSYGSGSGKFEMVKSVVENLASHANGSESEDGLTRATISPATIVITDQAAQTQDIALLNRDGAHRAPISASTGWPQAIAPNGDDDR